MNADTDGSITYRKSTLQDGPAVWTLVKNSGVLDVNSSYCYLLLCQDFAETCVVAEMGGKLVGFVTAYRPPGREDVLFVWQIGVDGAARGRGVASTLLDTLLSLDACQNITYIETTISPSNKPSRALFQSLARRLDTAIDESEGFAAELFPEGAHEPERLFRLGPLK
ncbi:MAG TPA: diaminobutyrate acetyltransferase [Gammaproteobacteria bacterium]|nr:diaminobutyrate acetyltransferase [Gammaproteobacteria bacterium]